MNYILVNGELYHHGIKGQKWGVRRFQNEDGSLTTAGQKRYYGKADKIQKKIDSFNGHEKGKTFLMEDDKKSISSLEKKRVKEIAKGDKRKQKDKQKAEEKETRRNVDDLATYLANDQYQMARLASKALISQVDAENHDALEYYMNSGQLYVRAYAKKNYAESAVDIYTGKKSKKNSDPVLRVKIDQGKNITETILSDVGQKNYDDWEKRF